MTISNLVACPVSAGISELWMWCASVNVDILIVLLPVFAIDLNVRKSARSWQFFLVLPVN
jgi:hypothetical protein